MPEYEITQNGNEFEWTAPAIHEHATGTINGTQITVSWNGDWGTGQDTGVIVIDSTDKVVRIEWSNGNVFRRL